MINCHNCGLLQTDPEFKLDQFSEPLYYLDTKFYPEGPENASFCGPICSNEWMGREKPLYVKI